jgi:hypothetical protein
MHWWGLSIDITTMNVIIIRNGWNIDELLNFASVSDDLRYRLFKKISHIKSSTFASVGLCVDFCAHIVHGFLTGNGSRYDLEVNIVYVYMSNRHASHNYCLQNKTK